MAAEFETQAVQLPLRHHSRDTFFEFVLYARDVARFFTTSHSYGKCHANVPIVHLSILTPDNYTPTIPHDRNTFSRDAYTDDDAFLSDCQTLLRKPLPNDSSILVADGLRLPLPSQILCARSHYFQTLLSARWHPYHTKPVSKPNAAAPVVQDILEFLITGVVTLSTRPTDTSHLLALSILADEFDVPTLQTTIAQHISNILAPDHFHYYLLDPTIAPSFPATFPVAPTIPAIVRQVIFSYLVHNLTLICEHLPLDWLHIRSLWLVLTSHLLSTSATHSQPAATADSLPPAFMPNLTPLADLLASINSSQSLHQLLSHESPTVRAAMLDVLLYSPCQTLNTIVAPLKLHSSADIHSAISASEMKSTSDLIICPAAIPDLIPVSVSTIDQVQIVESTHPQAPYTSLHHTLLRIDIPCLARPCVTGCRGWDSSLIVFDYSTSISPGTCLMFFERRPPTSETPESVEQAESMATHWVNDRPPNPFAMHGSFWVALTSQDPTQQHTAWGWRFAVVPMTRYRSLA